MLRQDSGGSVSLGVQMGCHSRSIRLVRGEDYEGSEQVRPLSPVNLRTKLPADKVVNQAPTLQMIKKRNEEKVRESPFISHKTVRDRESWLLRIGSLESPNDASLNMEINLKNQLSKIISPIKVKQNARGLHKPKVSKMPQHLQDELYEEEYLREMERLRRNPPEQEEVMSSHDQQQYNNHNHQQQQQQQYPPYQRGSESPMTLGQRTTGKSDKSASSQAAVAGISSTSTSIDRKYINQRREQHQEQEQLSVPVSIPRNSSNPMARQFEMDDYDQQLGGGGSQNSDKWQDRHPFISSNSPYGVPHSLVSLNGAATPISDLSDRDVFSAGSHLTGLYGDFEDDLVSAGSNNEDEYIRLEEKL